MSTDYERREAARRLREVEGYAIPDRRVADHPITGEVIAAAVMYDLPDVKGLLGRLADLIEPSCDRDELLEEAKELEKCAYYFGLDFDEDEPLRDRLKEASEAFAESARCIRKALGVQDA